MKKAKGTVDKVLAAFKRMGPYLGTITLDHVLDEANVSATKYMAALRIMNSKQCVLYKRKPNETMISPYNPILLKLWQANMNLQFVCGVYGLVVYLSEYVCKSEHYMSELMKTASKEAGNQTIADQLKPVGKVFVDHREVSVHEAIKRTLSLPLRKSNIATVWVPTGHSKDITRVLKPKEVLETMHDDDPDIYAKNIMDKYKHRGNDLEGICYAEFASTYTYVNDKRNIDNECVDNYVSNVIGHEESEENTDEKKKKSVIIQLRDNMGKLRKRERPCIPRWRNISELKEPEEYFMQKIQLYLPWRNENHLKHADGTYRSTFEEYKDMIEENMFFYEPNKELTMEDIPEPYMNLSDSESDEEEFCMDPTKLLEEEDPIDFDVTSNPAIARVKDLNMPDDLYYKMFEQLNHKQRLFFNYIMNYVQELKWNKSNNKEEPAPFYIFLSGPGGVGKSHLIKIITEYCRRHIKALGQTADQPSIQITATTGKAGCQIDGTTVHSAFILPCNVDLIPCSETISKLQKKYRHLKILVIDEISMLEFHTLKNLNIQLQHIFDNKEPFGGVSLLFSGDLLQLPAIGYSAYETKFKKASYENLTRTLWHEHFKIYELTEIVRQSEDPDYGELLCRVREGKHTKNDLKNIH